MAISPIAHVALLHTEISSGLRLAPKMGMKSAANRTKYQTKSIYKIKQFQINNISYISIYEHGICVIHDYNLKKKTGSK